MAREDILKEVLSLTGNNFLLELPTGVGKTRIALEKIKKLNGRRKKNLLIVVPRNVLKITWKEEIHKWWKNCPLDITYTTYVSFPKYKGIWEYVVWDECHHLSERCREALCDFSITYSILCSATINKTLKDELREVFSNITIYKKNLRDIIEDDILPDPKVYLIPLKLQTGLPTETIMKNPKARGRIVECNWANRWEYITQRSYPVKIYCSEFQYYQDLCSQIDYWKKKAKNSSFYINKWMKLCLDRLKWLSDKKVKYTQQILTKFLDYRTIVFCNSIEQTELLGEYCINSKNKKSLQYLEDFNSNRIDHITSCSMINEGLNLTNCQIGIFNNVNASETISIQRVGRILRHSNPILIIPYFINTREEELVKRMLENYNPDLITKILDIDELDI